MRWLLVMVELDMVAVGAQYPVGKTVYTVAGQNWVAIAGVEENM